MAEVTIIDSGGANLASLLFALQRLGVDAEVTTSPDVVRAGKRLMLPGVGAAGDAMQRLHGAALVEVIREARQPLLGICLGMQLLYCASEENPLEPGRNTQCIGVLPETVARLHAAPGRPVPHMGWNNIHARAPHGLLEGIAASDYVYYVHSFAAPVTDATLASCEYGASFCSIVQLRNFYGMQFHPERSGPVGARLLANFLKLPT
ncbi:MAG: imidazole glycerol phosphate synthase subunit HisH [Steroidobacteraceae bacterium]